MYSVKMNLFEPSADITFAMFELHCLSKGNQKRKYIEDLTWPLQPGSSTCVTKSVCFPIYLTNRTSTSSQQHKGDEGHGQC